MNNFSNQRSSNQDPLIIFESDLNPRNPLDDRCEYEINSGVQYRLIESTTTADIRQIQPIQLQQQIQESARNKNTQRLENNTQRADSNISEIQTNRPCIIYPKIPIVPNLETKTKIIEHPSRPPNRKRDEARRANHNEVERRRRDRINQWIEKLKILLPEDDWPEKPSSTSKTSNDSKSAILIRACDYIKNMKEEIESLKGNLCLEMDELVSLKEENSLLRAENEMLRIQNEKLKEVLPNEK
ncbi:uncharacterized protein LOC129607730 isoform X2 [Condylostylus longicornis]|nr:uncharacterized protein LOC129607730 isoform X2 [Condylostylus longicornis]